MRLLSNEHKDVTKLLDSHGLGKEVLLTKKKGWIHIKLKDQVFSYHRKKESTLVEGQFKDSFRYFIQIGHEKRELTNWTSVTKQLDLWLKSCE